MKLRASSVTSHNFHSREVVQGRFVSEIRSTRRKTRDHTLRISARELSHRDHRTRSARETPRALASLVIVDNFGSLEPRSMWPT